MGKQLPKHIEKLKPFIEKQPETVYQFAIHAMENGNELYNAAKEQLISKRYGLSRSLAISACEELGKFMMGILYLTKQISEDRFLECLYNHRPKQLWGLVISLFTPILTQNMSVSRVNPVSDINSFQKVFADIYSQLNEQSNIINPQISKKKKSITNGINAAKSGEHEDLRRAGLYVDLKLEQNKIHVKSPKMITKKQAKLELDKYEKFLKPMNSFVDKLSILFTHDFDLKDKEKIKLFEFLDQLPKQLKQN
jgi:AbiV family abortive infection protein